MPPAPVPVVVAGAPPIPLLEVDDVVPEELLPDEELVDEELLDEELSATKTYAAP